MTTFTTPLRDLQRALRATTSIKPDPGELMSGLAEVIIDGHELVQLTRHVAIRFAFTSSATTFSGEAFIVPVGLRKSILGVPASKVGTHIVSLTAQEGVVTATAGDVLDASEFAAAARLPPYQRMFRDHPLSNVFAVVRSARHVQPAVAPDWGVGFNPQHFALLAPYSKREHDAALTLTFFGQGQAVHFTFNDGLDGLIMPVRNPR